MSLFTRDEVCNDCKIVEHCGCCGAILECEYYDDHFNAIHGNCAMKEATP